MVETVLGYIVRDDYYLMLYRNKKKNDINEGMWIGLGGHIEKGETYDMALVREIKEESNLNIKAYKHIGDVKFMDNDYTELMHLYIITDFDGELKDSDEGDLKWIHKDDILNLNLFEGDKIFLRRILSNNYDFFNLDLTYDNKKFIGGNLYELH